MTARRLPRRLIVGASSVALLAGAVGFVPLLGSASAACTPTYKDAAGDAITVQDGAAVPGVIDLGNDPDLDIVDVTHTVDAGSFSSIVHVTQLEDFGPVVSYVDEFVTHFTVNGKVVDLAARRTHSMYTFFDGAPGFPDQGELDTGTLTVAGTATTVPVKVVVDLKASTVTATVAVPAMETALGGSLAGKPFTAMTAESNQIVNATTHGSPAPYQASPGLRVPMDDAAAPAGAAYAFGASCSGGGTPVPTDSGSPSPGATPSPSPTSTATPGGLFDQPRKGCVQYKDAAGDADPTPTGQNNEGSLDVTQVNLKSPADGSLQVFVKLADVGSGLNWPGEGGAYDVTTTIAGKAVVVSVDDSGAVTDATVGGTASTDLKPTVKLDAKNSNLVVTLPKDGLEKALKTTLAAGAAITGTSVETAVTTPPGPGFVADDAAGTTAAEKTYAYGDNTCFLPPPGVLAIDADAAGQYSDVTELFATLTDADDSPVQGAAVTARLGGGRTVTATTDEDGIADLRLPVVLKAGTTAITTTFAGNGEVGAVKAVTPFKVLAEKTVLKAVGIRGGVKATVLDDDRHPVVGRPVVFTVGSRKVVVKTNAQGVAVLGRLARGTAVKVGFPAVPGYYLATPSYTVKAL
jgi:hypothetical protein